MTKWKLDELSFDFVDEDIEEESGDDCQLEDDRGPVSYKILIADDDVEVHKISNLMIRDFEFEGKKIDVLHAYSGQETLEMMEAHPDVAILFLDVVMESNHAGLEVVKIIRKKLKNNMTRIILRTGQPGQAPENEVIRKYDINDYRLKTELTLNKFHVLLFTTLRNYRDLVNIESHRRGLYHIIEASSRLFSHNTLNDFLSSILDELVNIQDECNLEHDGESGENRTEAKEIQGFMTMEQNGEHFVVAATSKYQSHIGDHVSKLDNSDLIREAITSSMAADSIVCDTSGGCVIKNIGRSNMENFIYIDGGIKGENLELVQLFLSNFSMALDNFIMNNMMQTTQREIIYALGETVENHFDETGSHIKRVTSMMRKMALLAGYSKAEAEMMEVASSMHDLGKIGIPEHIIKKPGKLTDEEFAVIKKHPEIGYNILNKSKLPELQLAAQIALYHHEKYDGSGYPHGISGEGIPESARMMAIVDVFDAMTHKRVYKEAMSVAETLDFMQGQRGSHFDPNLLDLFTSNIDSLLEAFDE